MLKENMIKKLIFRERNLFKYDLNKNIFNRRYML